MRFIENEQHWIEKAADRLDGAGLWAAAKSAWAAAERVNEIVVAILERTDAERRRRK